MAAILQLLIIIQGLLFISATTKYNLDILEVEWNTTTPDAIDIDLKTVRPSRGVFGVSGHIEFKEDCNTDLTMAQVIILYSSNGISYQLTPFRVPKQPFTQGLNTAYKQYLMDAMVACCENAPEAKTFISPLTKRVIECDNCMFPTENFPSNMRPGYYRIVIMIFNDIEFNVSILLKVEVD